MSPTTFTTLAAALAALVAVSPLQAQTPPRKLPQPAVHQMEIISGGSRTVRNFGTGLSPSEAASLAELERLENEATFAREALALKRQYVTGERLLEPFRRNVQRDLYGRSTTRTGFDTFYSGAGVGYGSTFNRVGGFGFPYANGAGYASATSGMQTTETRSLADGVGDEGALKSAFAGVIAKQADSAYAASVAQDQRLALARAAASPRLVAALGLPSRGETRTDGGIRAASGEVGSPAAGQVVLTLADGKKVTGTGLDEGKEWITLKRLDGGTSRFRVSQVVQIDLPAGGGSGKIKPAVGE